MVRFAPRVLLCSILGVCLLAFGQEPSTESGVRLSVLVSNALERAIPSSEDLIARIWQKHGLNDKLSRADVDAEYRVAKEEYRRDAQVQLQPASRLFMQLNVIETIVLCANDANHELTSIATEAASANVSWQKVRSSWDKLSASLPCVSEASVQKEGSIANGRASLVEDGKVKMTLDVVVARVERAMVEVNKAVKSKDQAALDHATRVLANQLDLFCVVTAVQVTVLSKDIRGLVPTMGSDVESPKVLAKLERLLADAPED